MKRIFLYLFTNDFNQLVSFITSLLRDARTKSISIENYQKQPLIKENEHTLIGALSEKEFDVVIESINTLRDFYIVYGIKPDLIDSGYCNMTHLLDHVRELAVSTSVEWKQDG